MDSLARRYGVMPHEVLALDAWQFSLALLCFRQAKATSETHHRRIADRGGRVQPVMVLE